MQFLQVSSRPLPGDLISSTILMVAALRDIALGDEQVGHYVNKYMFRCVELNLENVDYFTLIFSFQE